MKVYRVYSFWHETETYGTTEYGIYSTLEKAREQMKKVIEMESGTIKTEEECCICYENSCEEYCVVMIDDNDIDSETFYTIVTSFNKS